MILVVLFILILTAMIKIGFDNIIDDDISYASTFLILLFLYSIFKSLNIIIILIVIFDIITIIYKKKINYQNFKYLLITIIITIICYKFSSNYCDYISLMSKADIGKYLEYYVNNTGNILFYHFFNDINTYFHISFSMETIPMFISICTLIYFFLVSDYIRTNHKNKITNTIALLSYFIFFLCYACFRFLYVSYIWLVFPINSVLSYLNKKNINIFDGIVLGISLISITYFIEDTIFAILLMTILLIVVELASKSKDYKHLITTSIVFIIAYITKSLDIILLCYLLVLCIIYIIVRVLKLRNIVSYILIVILAISIIYSLINGIYLDFSQYELMNNTVFIDYFTNNKMYLFILYFVMLLVCLIDYQKNQKIITSTFLLLLVVFNPLLINYYDNYIYTNILLMLLVNPFTIMNITNGCINILKRYDLSGNFIVVIAILVLFCSSNTLYPNVYDSYETDYNKTYRISNDEYDLYCYIYDNNIDISGHKIISQAPNTIAYFQNIDLLNDYHYYIELLNSEVVGDAPNNLTNIFAVRNYVGQQLFKQDIDLSKGNDELIVNSYDFLILRKNQAFVTDDEKGYLNVYLYYLQNGYNMIYDNYSYALLQIQQSKS